MYIKVINPKTNGKNAYSNQGSARQAANYLEHEAKEQGAKAVYFNGEKEGMSGDEVVTLLDGNRKGLRADDAKFYSLVISPSEKDLEHIGNDPAKLQAYTKDVMQAYAENFNLKDGRKLGEQDLVWAATQHNERIARGTDTQHQGQAKGGLHTHIHIMVSARDREQKMTLNPLGTIQRFNQVKFSATGNVIFDAKFDRQKTADYTRPSSSERPVVSAKSIAEKEASIRRRMAANERNPSRNPRPARPEKEATTGRFQPPNRQQREAKTLTPAQQAARDMRLLEQVKRINQKLDERYKLDYIQVKNAGATRDFDKTFYSRLGRIGREAAAGKNPLDPYIVLATGRVSKGVDVGNAQPINPVRGRNADRQQAAAGIISPTKTERSPRSAYPTAGQALRGNVHRLAAAMTPTTQTQDVRGEWEQERS